MTGHGVIDRYMRVPALVELDIGQAFVFSCASPAKHTGNEDCGAVYPGTNQDCLLVVADGIGGYANGAGASAHVTASLQKSIHTPVDIQDRLEHIEQTLQRANQEIIRRRTGEGTTVAVVHLKDDQLHTCHAGDSDILLVSKTGELKYKTLAHSPVAEALEMGLISEQAAITHQGRNFISNYLGDPEMFLAISDSVTYEDADTLILASDGLFDNLYQDEILEIISQDSLETASTQLADIARERMKGEDPGLPSKPDDLTFIVYRA